jgi:primase-polymerase (primpol)-like protein
MINDAILSSLKAMPQWVCWRYEMADKRKTKVPYQVAGYKAASDNPHSWTSYQNASRARGFDGVGIMFANGLCGIDLDHHTDGQNDYIGPDGKPTATALEWICAIPTYWEVSPSKQGLHALALGSLPEGRRQDDRQGAAFYDHHRFFTVTGNHLDGTPADAMQCTNELNIMYRWLFGDKPQPAIPANPIKSDLPLPDTALDTSIIAMLQRDERYSKLWRCDFAEYKNDHSAADLALAGRIMRAVSNHAAWADRIIRRWPGMRDKWDVRHFGNGDTYGQHTLKVAVADLDTPEEPRAVIDRVAYGYGEIRSKLPTRRALTLQVNP